MTEKWPRLADEVTIDEPIKPGAPWILSVAGTPRARVGRAVARFVVGLNSETPAVADGSLSSQEMDELLRALAAAGLLAGTERRTPRSRRLQFRPPASVQLTLINPTRIAFALARPLGNRLVRLVLLITIIVVLLLGLLSAIVYSADIIAVISEPVYLEQAILIAVAFVLSGAIHEAGHAVALAYYGGRPHRAGVMLFYLTPAFFCDVTNGWRLGGRRARGIVALAGPGVHLVLAAIAATAMFWSVGERAGLACFVVIAFTSAITNLIPFVHLDGYIALVALTDRPFLRASAMRAVRDAVARLLGAYAPRPSPWMIIFGIACQLFPVFILGWAYLRAQSSLSTSEVGAVIGLLLASIVLGALVRAIVGFLRGAFHLGLKPVRVATAAVLVAAGLVGISFLQTSDELVAGFVVRGPDVFLVQVSGYEPVLPGSRVTLTTNGAIVRLPAGTAKVVGLPTPLAAPLSAFTPIDGLGDVAAIGYRLDIRESLSLPSSGVATVSIGSTTVGKKVFDLLIGNSIQRLRIGQW